MAFTQTSINGPTGDDSFPQITRIYYVGEKTVLAGGAILVDGVYRGEAPTLTQNSNSGGGTGADGVYYIGIVDNHKLYQFDPTTLGYIECGTIPAEYTSCTILGRGSVFVAQGYVFSGYRATLAISTDGLNWTEIISTGASENNMTCLLDGEVVYADRNYCYTVTERGLTQIPGSNIADLYMEYMAAYDGALYIAGSMISGDGIVLRRIKNGVTETIYTMTGGTWRGLVPLRSGLLMGMSDGFYILADGRNVGDFQPFDATEYRIDGFFKSGPDEAMAIYGGSFNGSRLMRINSSDQAELRGPVWFQVFQYFGSDEGFTQRGYVFTRNVGGTAENIGRIHTSLFDYVYQNYMLCTGGYVYVTRAGYLYAYAISDGTLTEPDEPVLLGSTAGFDPFLGPDGEVHVVTDGAELSATIAVYKGASPVPLRRVTLDLTNPANSNSPVPVPNGVVKLSDGTLAYFSGGIAQ